MRAVAKRYAAALYALAEEQGVVDAVQKELEVVSETLERHSSYAYLLNHPHISVQEKKNMLLSVFSEMLSDISRHFLQLLVDKGRQEIIADVATEFAAIANEARGVFVGEAVSAVALSDTERSQLEAAFSAKVGKRVELRNVVEPTLKGGVLLRLGDKVYDGSVAGKLTRFKKQLRDVQVQ